MIALPLSPCSHPNSQLLYLFAFAHSFLGKLSTFAPITDQSAIALRQCRSSYIIHIIPCISPVQILWSTYRVISGQRQVSSNPRNKKTFNNISLQQFHSIWSRVFVNQAKKLDGQISNLCCILWTIIFSFIIRPIIYGQKKRQSIGHASSKLRKKRPRREYEKQYFSWWTQGFWYWYHFCENQFERLTTTKPRNTCNA